MKLPNRKHTRLYGFDYSSANTYFVTMCTRNKEKILSEITVGNGVLDIPQIKLSAFGKIAEKYILQLNDFYGHISVENYIIMPHHIHLLIRIDNACGASGTPHPTNMELPKFISTFKRFCNKEYGLNIWQTSYHDHIVRNEDDYNKIWQYIENNHLKWTDDIYFE